MGEISGDELEERHHQFSTNGGCNMPNAGASSTAPSSAGSPPPFSSSSPPPVPRSECRPAVPPTGRIEITTSCYLPLNRTPTPTPTAGRSTHRGEHERGSQRGRRCSTAGPELSQRGRGSPVQERLASRPAVPQATDRGSCGSGARTPSARHAHPTADQPAFREQRYG